MASHHWGALLLLPLLLVTSSGQTSVANLNAVVDILLDSVQEELRLGPESGGRIAKVPNVNKTWTKGKGIFKVSASVNCTDGRVASLGKIARDGDVILKKEGGEVSLRAALQMEELVVEYDRCQLKVSGVKSTSPLQLKASSLSLVSQLSMVRTPVNCTNRLDYMVVTSLGKLSSDMGPGAMAWIKERLLEYFADAYHDTIVNSVNAKLESATTKALVSKKDICSRIFFYARIR